MFIIRVLQQLLLFSSMYFTLYFWGESTYVMLNKVLFFLLIVTCLIQPIIDMLWKGKLTIEEALIAVGGTGLLIGIILLGSNLYIVSIMAFYITVKSVERILYVTSCIRGTVSSAQVRLAVLYLIEFSSILISVFSINSLDISDRLLSSVIAYLSLFYLYKDVNIKFKKLKINIKEFICKYRESIGLLFYFLFSSLLLNMDRLVVGDFINNVSRSVSYLFYLSVFFAVFGLFGYNFDRVRKNIKENKPIPFIKFFLPICIVSTLVFILITLFNYEFPYIFEYFKVSYFSFTDVASIVLITLSIYLLMMICTVYIQKSIMKIPLIMFSLLALSKLVWIYQFGIVFSNYLTFILAIMMSFLLLHRRQI